MLIRHFYFFKYIVMLKGISNWNWNQPIVSTKFIDWTILIPSSSTNGYISIRECISLPKFNDIGLISHATWSHCPSNPNPTQFRIQNVLRRGWGKAIRYQPVKIRTNLPRRLTTNGHSVDMWPLCCQLKLYGMCIIVARDDSLAAGRPGAAELLMAGSGALERSTPVVHTNFRIMHSSGGPLWTFVSVLCWAI